MGESDPRAVAHDRSEPAIRLDCGLAGATGFSAVLPSAAGAGFTPPGMGSGARVRRRRGRSDTTYCGRDSQAAGTGLAGCERGVGAAEEVDEPGTARCRTGGECSA